MEELQKIHKDVPFGYWTLWVAPAFKALARRRRASRRPGADRDHLIVLASKER